MRLNRVDCRGLTALGMLATLAWGCLPASGPPLLDAGPPALAEEGLDAEELFAQALTGHRNRLSTGDLDAIKRDGSLRVITRNNATSYFLYRGKEAGFDLELARLLAKELGVRLEVVVPPSRRDLVPYLLDGRGDIVLSGMSTQSDRADRVAFTSPTVETSWVVVVQKKDLPRLRNLGDLDGKTLLVSASSGALRRVRFLNEQNKLHIQARAAVESEEQEDLLDMVSDGEVDGAVMEKRVADVELEQREDLALAQVLPGEADQEAWALRPDNTRLMEAAETFLRKYRRGVEWNVIYKRYHDPSEHTARVREPEWRADRSGSLTPWDPQFKAVAREQGLDWRLLAAQAYQESRFDPLVRSPMGAVGLMQLMPAVSLFMGVKNPKDPMQSLQAGARHFGRILASFKGDSIKLKDRVRFSLAAYNAGRGHLEDARRLSAQRGADPNRWFDNVANAMLLLSKPRHYRHARFGYCRGEEPVKYVSQIQARYDAYVALTDKPQIP